MQFKKRWIAAAVAIVVVAGLWAFRSETPEQSAPPPASSAVPAASGEPIQAAAPVEEGATPVQIAPATVRTITQTVTVTGQLAPSHQVDLSPKISGTVVEIIGDIGTPVDAGEVVLRLDEASQMVQYRQAEASLAAAVANLDRLKAGATPEERNQAEAALRQAEVQLEQARTAYNRTEKLYEEQVVSREQLDSARTQLEIAEAQYETAEQQLARLESGPTVPEVRAAEAQVAQAEASLDMARLQLEWAEVAAPIDGLIARLNVDVGAAAAPGSSALTLVDIDRVFVQAALTDRYVNRVRPGSSVSVDVDATGSTFQGSVYTVSPISDGGGMFPIEIAIENPEHHLKPGMYARVHLPVAQAADAVVIPERAIVRVDGAPAVYVVDANQPATDSDEASPSRTGIAHLRPVRLGVQDGEWASVAEGLQPNEHVVINGHSSLTDGAHVQFDDAPEGE